jgi:hypothetical protein
MDFADALHCAISPHPVRQKTRPEFDGRPCASLRPNARPRVPRATA